MSRQLLDKIHKWLGLFGLFFLLIQAVTGVLIVNGARTQQWLDPHSYRLDQPASVQLPLERYTSAAISRNGQAVASLVLPESATSPVLAVVVPQERALPEMVSIHPATGKVISRNPVLADPVVLANLLHGELGAGKAGKALLMVTGLSLVVLSITGFLRWWPGLGKVRRSLKLRWAGSVSATLWQWHGVIGAVLAILFVWLGLTGALLVGRPFLEPLVNQGNRSADFPELGGLSGAAVQVPAKAISMDDAFAVAKQAMGDDELRSVLPLSRLSPQHTFVFADHQGRMGVVRVSAAGQISERYRPADMPAANRALDWMLPLHRGSMLPEWLRTVYYVLASGLVLLASSGLVINRKKARLRKRPARAD
ncbi:PepSY-associated TM helix domain-containing protein [Novosphingobium sp.]|uniref:PepSY-associated TM helix domain-containing protein n=1 Tax=Novosphingobium sp. TaxID=1874826 RepID=UPI002620F110|nr:PepSY-associated TM helix domain-containing protein [Novosphingobium sp.]